MVTDVVQDGLIFAYVLDGAGGGEPIDWEGVRAWKPHAGPMWVHLDFAAAGARAWFDTESGVDPIVREALLATEPRPRSVETADGLMIIVRGVNLNVGAQPEDMVSIRVWIEPHRIITLRHRRVNAAKELRDKLERGDNGPMCAGDFLVDLTNLTLNRIGAMVSSLEDAVHELEVEVLSAESTEPRHVLARNRRRAIALRRYIAPQRDVLARLPSAKASWLGELDRVRLRECADRLTRMVEDLDAARDRAAVTQEELASRLSEQMNRRLYLLSLYAAVFLPLGLVTGVFGVNLGGIPGIEYRWGFAILCVGMVVLSGALLWFFKRLKWL